MNMNIDALYPALSSLAQSKGRGTLKECGARGNPKSDKYWNLDDSCWSVLNKQPRWRCDPYQTLKTFDEFIGRLPANSPTRRKIWDKIVGNESAYLDAVVETAWALHFWDNGKTALLEVPFDSANPKSKDADVVVTLDGVKHWLDATSIKLNENDFPVPTVNNPFVQIRPDDDVLARLASKARNKYEEKFGAAVRSGLFKEEFLGVLLCTLKSEKEVLPVFDFGLLPPPPPPPGLLDDKRPGLNLVWVHTLNPSQDSEILQPWVISKWQTT